MKRRRLTRRRRQHLPGKSFALPARRALPIIDAAHVRAAVARLSMMLHLGHVTAREHASALRRIRAAARRYGVTLSGG